MRYVVTSTNRETGQVLTELSVGKYFTSEDSPWDVSFTELTPSATLDEVYGNTPIEELLAEYEAELCDHSNIEWVKRAALRYVETMQDSQVRCLLYTLAKLP